MSIQSAKVQRTQVENCVVRRGMHLSSRVTGLLFLKIRFQSRYRSAVSEDKIPIALQVCCFSR
jgi:hypothetical protein